MMHTKEIADFLDAQNYIKRTFAEISEHHENIKSEQMVYDFDAIKRSLAGEKCTSADAMYLKKHIYLIEFKTGFASEKKDVNTNTHKENLKLKIRLKAYESLALFEKIIVPKIEDGILDEKVQKICIAVIDTAPDPMQAYADILREKSGNLNTFRNEIFKDSLLIYGKETRNKKKLFYDRVDVWYDYEFDKKILKLA